MSKRSKACEINKIHNIDCLEGLKLLDNESIDCCVTSPPYYALRDYGTSHWSGGNPNCDHVKKYNSMQSDRSTLGGREPEQTVNDKRREINTQFSEVCGKCGAIRIDEQIGLEETPEQYVEKLVQVFHEVKRALKKDGTLWLNLGDSYSGNCSRTSTGRAGMGEKREGIFTKTGKNIKPKDLIGIPWLVAFALRADGWYLRQDIIWHKPNPMPESVTDRCTKSHEYIFLLSKSPKYYFDNEAIKEDAITEVNTEIRFGGNKYGDNESSKFQTYSGNVYNPTGKRNKRDVWAVNLKPFKESHFATFPEELITPCILAGCPKEGVVLDPFMGAGTTALVALKNHRQYVGFELNEEYCELADKRIEQQRVTWGQIAIGDNHE